VINNSLSAMDLRQLKLSKAEWDGIEVPVSPSEKRILTLIQQGYHDVSIKHNDTLSLLGFLKVKETDSMQHHLFLNYLVPMVKDVIKKYEDELEDDYVETMTNMLKTISIPPKKVKPIQKADSLRLSNSSKTLKSVSHDDIFEFVLIDEFEMVLKSIANEENVKAIAPVYTLNTLINYEIHGLNHAMKTFIDWFVTDMKKSITPRFVVAIAPTIFEKNQRLLKFANQTLYSHQKKLFTVMKRPGKKIVLYTAPTGTGKTISPIGLAESKKVIFVCAARHVGLALARSALSVGRKIAFAFGCETPGDVKLHYAAAVDYIKDWKTGGIRKVDNSNGSKVEMIITDVQSYVSAMHYMLAFTDQPDDIVMYWDEPTISLDYDEHSLHPLIRKTWKENVIPNIVLSSATLPSADDLSPMLDELKSMKGFDVYSILSQDFKKTIPLLGETNSVQMPHFVAKTNHQLKASARHCLTHNSVMRYIDVEEAVRFILAATSPKHDWLTDKANADSSLSFTTVFPDIESVTLQSIKVYYCNLCAAIDDDKFDRMKSHFAKIGTKPRYESTIHLTTTDANTITDGPALYLTNDVDKVAKVLLKEANIARDHLNDIMKGILMNNSINTKVEVLQKQLEDQLKLKEVKEKKQDLDNRMLTADSRQMLNNIENLQSQIKVVSLDDSYIPNKLNHQRKYVSEPESLKGKPFCSDIPEGVVEEIMLINGIDDSWKVLLMMGIGVFAKDLEPTYAEIMKDLADTQQLFLIIASTDYIYGTNYQFCHGYIGKDLGDISQEKCIQALGRIGRNKLQYEYTIRFRCDELLEKVFFEDKKKPEAQNMNRLFSSFE
jgi:hypothetical protein